jgi:hypothetical protein
LSLLHAIFSVLVKALRRLSMSDAEQPAAELYREAADRLRELARFIHDVGGYRLADVA